MSFNLGDKVRTTKEFNDLSNNNIEGVVETVCDEFIDVKTDDSSITSVGKQWLEIFKLRPGDKVETTEDHYSRFDSHHKGVIERVDGDYIDLRCSLAPVLTLHKKWVKRYKGDLLIFYEGKLI